MQKVIFLLISTFLFNACVSDNREQETFVVPGNGVSNIHLIVLPDDGKEALLVPIEQAQHSIFLTMYLLTSDTVIEALEEAANRGIQVFVLLEEEPAFALNSSLSPRLLLDRLMAAGIQAKAANPAYDFNHIKTMIIDGHTAYIMTCNLTRSALGESQYQQNREYIVVTNNPEEVTAIVKLFEADWHYTTPVIANNNLIISPTNARTMLTTLINQAQSSLFIEAEIMHDEMIAETLANAARRGVRVQILLPEAEELNEGGPAQNAEELVILNAADIAIHSSTRLYMHAKMMLIDNNKAYIGSINFSRGSMERNRELGIIIADPTALARLQQNFILDWDESDPILTLIEHNLLK